MQELAPYMTLGTQLTLTVLVFAAVGWFFDTRNGTLPIWTGALSGLGAGIGLANLIRSLIRLSRKNTGQQAESSAQSIEEN